MKDFDPTTFLNKVLSKLYSDAYRLGGSIAVKPIPFTTEELHLWIYFAEVARNVIMPIALKTGRLDEHSGRILNMWPLVPFNSLPNKFRVNVGYVVVDTSALIEGLPTKLADLGFLRDCIIGIPKTVILEIARMEEEAKRSNNRSLLRKSEKASYELHNLNFLKEQRKIKRIEKDIDKIDIQVLDFEKPARAAIIDNAIREVTMKKNALLLTCDSGLARIASGYSGVDVFYVPPGGELIPFYLPTWKLWFFSILKLKDGKSLQYRIRTKSGPVQEIIAFKMTEQEFIQISKNRFI